MGGQRRYTCMPAPWYLVLLRSVRTHMCMSVMVSLLITALILLDQGPTLMTSSNLNFLKGLSFSTSRLKI